MANKILLSVYVTRQQRETLRGLARSQKKSMAAILRDALDLAYADDAFALARSQKFVLDLLNQEKS